MRRLVIMLTVVAALVLSAGAALADTRGDAGSQIKVKPLEGVEASVPTEGLTAPLSVEGGQPVPNDSARRSSLTAGSTAQWLDGTSSNTNFFNIITGTHMMLTTEWVGYWGTEDLSYPKTGELYYGRAVIGNVGTISTHALPNVQLPPNTHFAIDPSKPEFTVRCFFEDLNTGAQEELTGAECDQSPSQGLYGAQFSPQVQTTEHTESGFWKLRPGEVISVVFPIYSTSELKGWAATPADCLEGAVWATASVEMWDAPEPIDTCPFPRGHGVSHGVFISFNAPTVGYPTPSATNVTGTGARTTGYLFSHFDPGTAFVDLGTTTSYGRSSSVAIPGTSDSFTLNTDWTDLKPGTTYHWRLRFVDQKGRTFMGADQTFKTAPDTVRPSGSVLINGGATTTSSRTVKLTLKATDPAPASGVAYMRFRNGGTTIWSAWQAYSTTKSWTLTSGAGTKTVYAQFKDRAGNVSAVASDSISYRP